MTISQPRRRWSRTILLVALLLIVVAGVGFYLRPLEFYDHGTRAWLRWEGVKSANVRLGPYRIHCLVAGEGKPLVLVHGLGSRAQDWALLIPPLSKHGYRVYALDLLGYGSSDRPDVDYSIALQTEIVRQFLDSQGLQQADVGGWSMGGWVALKFTLDHPERVRRLFVYDSAGINFKPSWDTGLFSSSTPEQIDQFVAILTPHARHVPGFVARDLIRSMTRQRWIVQRSLASMKAGNDLLDGKLQAIRQPVAILWGKQDVTTPLASGEEMHREMPQSILAIFDGCGHLAPVECRDQFLPETLRFLEANPPLPGGVQEFPPAK